MAQPAQSIYSSSILLPMESYSYVLLATILQHLLGSALRHYGISLPSFPTSPYGSISLLAMVAVLLMVAQLELVVCIIRFVVIFLVIDIMALRIMATGIWKRIHLMA